jgi:multidrug transporter EmrE-like cation transporter
MLALPRFCSTGTILEVTGIIMEKLLLKNSKLWLVIVFLLVWVVSTMFFGWVVKHTVTGDTRQAVA